MKSDNLIIKDPFIKEKIDKFMYKYTEKFVADKLFNENSIRIGTLYGFRDMEHKNGISDPKEGKFIDKAVLDHFDSDIHVTSEELDQFLSPMINFNGIRPKRMVLKNISDSRTVLAKNYLIFCYSKRIAFRMFKLFDKSDTCYEITSHDVFFNLITEALQIKLNCPVTFHGLFPVSYGNFERTRAYNVKHPFDAAIVKTNTFRSQHEIRAIWSVPDNVTLTEHYYDLEQVDNLSSCCKLLNIKPLL